MTIYISIGPEQVLKRIPNVLGSSIANALNILNQNGFENLIPLEEDSLEPEGDVLRMEDPEGNEITPNTQVDVTTEITVYYSSGEFFEKMPDVLGKTRTEAERILRDLEFSNIEVVEEYHETVEEGKVIRANIRTGDKVNVTTEIVLTVSKGPEPTEPPTTVPPETTQPSEPTEPTPPEVQEVTKEVVVSLPTDRTEPYKLTIMLGSGVTVVDSLEIQPGTATITVSMTGYGTMTYEIYIDGEYIRSEEVVFSE